MVRIRRFLLPAAGLLAASALVLPQAASASTASSRATHRPATASHPYKIARPGAGHGPVGVTPMDTKAVHPRLSLPGCPSQDGYNGNVEWWTTSPSWSRQSYIQSWGQVWDLCGTVAQVYLSFTDPGGNNVRIGEAGAAQTVGVNWGPSNAGWGAGNIAATVCANWQGKWRCGTPYHI